MTLLQLSKLPPDQVMIFDTVADKGDYPLRWYDLITFAYRINGKAVSKTVRRHTAAIFFPALGLIGCKRGRPGLAEHLHRLPVRIFVQKFIIEKYGTKKIQQYLNRSIQSLQVKEP